jgi:hypothetical protein
MTRLDFEGVPIDVGAEIKAAHRDIWERIALPGNWWHGAERVAIAAAVRGAAHCKVCDARREVLSPLAVPGPHEHDGTLPDEAIEVVHQVTRDPGRLSKAWFDAVIHDGLSEEQYIETLGVVVAVISIDAFCRGLGVDPHPLPAPEPGETTRHRPAGTVSGEAWVPMLPAAASSGPEADLFPSARVPNVARAMSLVPDCVRMLKQLSAAHYLPMEQVIDPKARRTLDRAQMELLAGRVSALNECFY